jgi:opacity protein-like surface antigen
MGKLSRFVFVVVMMTSLLWMTATPASAESEATFVVGGLLGGSFIEILEGDFSLQSTFENGTLLGGRLGWYGFPLGVEGSFVYSGSGLAVDILDDLSLDARVMYGELNALLIILPGPVQPFVTGGGGLHYFELPNFEDAKVYKFGWNFGGGVKAHISRLALRFDIRDHRTTFSAEEFGLDYAVAEALGVSSVSVNNVEISFGVGIRF